MGTRNRQHLLREVKEICNRLVLAINPPGQKLRIELVFLCSCDITGVNDIGHDKHLQAGVNPAKLPFLVVILDLPKSVQKRLLTAFQLDMNHGQAIDEQGHIQTTVRIHWIGLVTLHLMDNLIARLPTCHIVSPDN